MPLTTDQLSKLREALGADHAALYTSVAAVSDTDKVALDTTAAELRTAKAEAAKTAKSLTTAQADLEAKSKGETEAVSKLTTARDAAVAAQAKAEADLHSERIRVQLRDAIGLPGQVGKDATALMLAEGLPEGMDLVDGKLAGHEAHIKSWLEARPHYAAPAAGPQPHGGAAPGARPQPGRPGGSGPDDAATAAFKRGRDGTAAVMDRTNPLAARYAEARSPQPTTPTQ